MALLKKNTANRNGFTLKNKRTNKKTKKPIDHRVYTAPHIHKLPQNIQCLLLHTWTEKPYNGIEAVSAKAFSPARAKF